MRVTLAGITSDRYRKRSRLTSRTVTFAPKPAAIFAALIPTIPPPRMTPLAGGCAGRPPAHATKKYARPAFTLLQVLRRFLDRHSAGAFRHRGEKRQLPVRQ